VAPTERVWAGVPSSPRVASFGYHEVTDDPRTTGFQRSGALPFTLTPRAFELQLDMIAAGPLVPTLVTGVDLDRPGDHLLLTFDDGGKSAVHAANELSRRGWRGHFFVTTGRVGTRTFLDWEEIRHLRNCGHLVGSHSHTHPNIFRELAPQAMREEWRRSSDLLGERLGEPCVAASVPGGEVSPTVMRIAAEEGLQFLFTVEPQLHPQRVGGCWILGRHLIKNRMTPAQVGELVNLRGWGRALAARRIKNLARRAVPTLYRRLIESRTGEWREELD
jgi:peptidoglycan/xylan/chitin deacetylase (PgdA/CDA1 family)